MNDLSFTACVVILKMYRTDIKPTMKWLRITNLLDSKNYDDREKRKKGKIKNVTGISVSIYPSINRMQRLTRETLARFAQRI